MGGLLREACECGRLCSRHSLQESYLEDARSHTGRSQVASQAMAGGRCTLPSGTREGKTISLGGKSLAEFASTTEWGDFGDEDLDELLEALD